jgi:transposase
MYYYICIISFLKKMKGWLCITVILHMLLLGILTLTDRSNWTFKFLHIVMEALHENIAIFAYLDRVVPNGRDGTLAIYNATSCRTYRYNLDAGYAGKLIDWTKQFCNWILEIVKLGDGVKGFQMLPRRWVVKRTFEWLNSYRRLSKDHEDLPETSESMIYAAMSHFMIKRLSRIQASSQ